MSPGVVLMLLNVLKNTLTFGHRHFSVHWMKQGQFFVVVL